MIKKVHDNETHSQTLLICFGAFKKHLSHLAQFQSWFDMKSSINSRLGDMRQRLIGEEVQGSSHPFEMTVCGRVTKHMETFGLHRHRCM